MVKEKKSFLKWIKSHKRELITAGISVTMLVAIVLGANNIEILKALLKSLRERISNPTSVTAPQIPSVAVIEQAPALISSPMPTETLLLSSKADSLPFEVQKHIRNLHEGWHASAEKIATALDNGIILEAGQTWVENYMKGAA